MGAFSDILGAIGEGLADSDEYTKYRRGRKVTEAMGDFAADPLAAVQRLQQAGFGSEALELHKLHEANEIKRLSATTSASDKAFDNNRSLDAYVGALLNRVTPENYGATRQVLERLKTSRKYDMPFDLPEQYDEQLIAPLRNFGMTQPNLVSRDNAIDRNAQSDRNNVRTTGASIENNKRTTGASIENNKRTTGTSAANNVRTTNTSSANNIRSNNQSDTNNKRTTTTSVQTAGMRGSGTTPAPLMPPMPPKKVGERKGGPGGSEFISKDGKSWTRVK